MTRVDTGIRHHLSRWEVFMCGLLRAQPFVTSATLESLLSRRRSRTPRLWRRRKLRQGAKFRITRFSNLYPRPILAGTIVWTSPTRAGLSHQPRRLRPVPTAAVRMVCLGQRPMRIRTTPTRLETTTLRATNTRRRATLLRRTMKILVATALTQGTSPDDYHYGTEGELVLLQEPCDRDKNDPAGPCGCGRAFAGAASHRATTTAMVGVTDDTRRCGARLSNQPGGWRLAGRV